MDALTGNELAHRFRFHPATGVTGPKHQKVRELLLTTAEVLAELVPSGREQSLAVTKLEEAMMWANAGIARGEAPLEGAEDAAETGGGS